MKNKKILEGTKGLFMKYGIKSVSMDDIARHLGMSKKTLYQFVENKEELIFESLSSYLEDEMVEVQKLSGRSRDVIDEMFNIARMAGRQLREINPATIYDLQKYYPEIWRKFKTKHEEYTYDKIKENIEKGIQSNLYRGDLDVDIATRFYIGKTLVLVDDKLFPASNFKKEEIFKEFITYHIHGIASPKGLVLLQKYLKEKEL